MYRPPHTARALTALRLAPLPMAAALVLAGTAAWAGALSASPPVQVVDHPLAATSPACSALVAAQSSRGSTNYPGSEVEPMVASDPSDPEHLVAAVQQDRWNDGGANGLTVTVSRDGGKTWGLASSQPAFSICAGAAPGDPGFFQRATDPWVSFSADGRTVYAISDSFNADGPAFGGASTILISRSTDGGDTWSTPATAQLDTSFTVLNDKESITADPTAASRAYAVWDRLVSPSTHANPSAFNFSPAFRGPVLFSSTSDTGQTWSSGRVIYDPGQNNQTIGNEIVVEPAGAAKGTLIDGFNLILTKGGFGKPSATFSVALIRSTDHGATWSTKPVIIAPLTDAPVTINGHDVRTGDIIPQFAADPVTGTLYATWQDGALRSTGAAKVALSTSTDGGLHWSTPVRIDQSPGDVPAFTPSIHVSADGTVAVTYYDLQNATPSSPGLTDVYLVHCHAASTDCAKAANWAAGGQTRLSTTGSFDMTTAPDAGGYFTGDYEAITSFGTTFASYFVMARPVATSGLTDSFASTTK
jgi:hypothetical protein